jgi:hypothetical protein
MSAKVMPQTDELSHVNALKLQAFMALVVTVVRGQGT